MQNDESRSYQTLPTTVSDHVQDLSISRLKRLEEAKEWFLQHDPKWLAEWQRNRGFADYVEDGWQDDRRAIEIYLTRNADDAAKQLDRHKDLLESEPMAQETTQSTSRPRSWIHRAFGL